MSPWVDDPETGTSHYEKPKRKTNRELRREAERAAGLEETPDPEESFGAKMARIKREKKAIEANRLAVIARLESMEVQGS